MPWEEEASGSLTVMYSHRLTAKLLESYTDLKVNFKNKRLKNKVLPGKTTTPFLNVFYCGHYMGWPHSTKSQWIITWRMETTCCINVVAIWGRIHRCKHQISLFSLTQQVCSWQQQIVQQSWYKEGRADIQLDTEKVEEWLDMIVVQSGINKCKVLVLGRCYS